MPEGIEKCDARSVNGVRIDADSMQILPGLCGYHLVKAAPANGNGVLSVLVAAVPASDIAARIIGDIRQAYPHQNLRVVNDQVTIIEKVSKRAAAAAKGGA